MDDDDIPSDYVLIDGGGIGRGLDWMHLLQDVRTYHGDGGV